MSTTSSERSQNPLRFRNRFAQAATATVAVLVSACLAAPVASGDGTKAPAPDRAGLSEIARDVLRCGATGPAQSVDEPTMPSAPDDEKQAVDGSAPDRARPGVDLVPAIEGISSQQRQIAARGASEIPPAGGVR